MKFVKQTRCCRRRLAQFGARLGFPVTLSTRREFAFWMKSALFAIIGLSAQAFASGLNSCADLVVRDVSSTPPRELRVTYLGTNGYQFECNGRALLVDPYFSRVDLLSVALGLRLQPDATRIEEGLKHLAPRADAILVTHGHFDHLLDVPVVMAKTEARLIASPTGIRLVGQTAGAGGSPSRRSGEQRQKVFDAVTAGDSRRIGPWKIRVLPAAHDRLFGSIPFDGQVASHPPRRAADWVCGEPLAFLIEACGRRIYIDSGGTSAQLPPAERVDLAILGVALPDSRARMGSALGRLQPRYVLPSHQDNFFLPLSRGFQFGPLTDFARVRQECLRAGCGRLIVLDYFSPWTLPRE